MKKNGFTIVEIVIALAIISMVSLTATSLVIASQRMSQKTRDRFFAIDLKNNALAVFTSLSCESNDFPHLIDTYKDRMNKALGYDMSNAEITDNKATFTLNFDENWVLNNEKVKNVGTITLYTDDNSSLSISIIINAKGVKITDSYRIYLEGV